MGVPESIIELRRVSKSFGRQRVLDDIDLKIERGRTTVIIGRSGTGKSVLIKHIVGLLRPDRGEVYFGGQRIDQLGERKLVPIRRQISFVFQLNALFDSLSVVENVAFPMTENSVGRVSKRRIRELARRCLELVGLAGFEHKRPAELSGGEKKRVAVARTLALEPDIIPEGESEPIAVKKPLTGREAMGEPVTVTVEADGKASEPKGDDPLLDDLPT